VRIVSLSASSANKQAKTATTATTTATQRVATPIAQPATSTHTAWVFSDKFGNTVTSTTTGAVAVTSSAVRAVSSSSSVRRCNVRIAFRADHLDVLRPGYLLHHHFFVSSEVVLVQFHCPDIDCHSRNVDGHCSDHHAVAEQRPPFEQCSFCELRRESGWLKLHQGYWVSYRWWQDYRRLIDSLSGGTIAGIVVGALVGLVIIGSFVGWLYVSKHWRDSKPS